ncbi:MAG TPA: selenocysteine-specific translation elongation factor [Pyrinomonadaceae bacterium]|jgi:selenocysteine-specific elongation factor|nr:selenocysteine-specific translation elongation factor [Pyrinomonadaceae bacterium]
MRSIIVGTAGHIDHGKTALVRALTGVDADRLPEEKRRGITIDLGFAELDLDDVRIGFVDVPGHERFIKNMLAGAHGIDVVALVIAADEGVMPQTREHFDICRLLDVRNGIIVITKTDTVDEELLELVRAEAEELVAGSFLEGAPVLNTSARTGAGIAELKKALREVALDVPARSSEMIARLPVDRAFTMRGFGAVVTGTLVAGSISEGDEMELLPACARVRVRGVQVHGQAVGRAEAGQRTAVNLGGVEAATVERGMVLAPLGRLRPTQMIDVRADVLEGAPRALRSRARVRVHLGAAEVLARVRVLEETGEIAPGAQGFLQLRLESPVVALPGERFIIRSYSPAQTIAGGLVLDPLAAKHRGREASQARTRLAALTSSADRATQFAIFVETSGERGLRREDIAARTGWLDELLDQSAAQAVERSTVFHAENIYIGSAAFERLSRAALDEIEEHHKREPLSRGLPRETLRERHFAHTSTEVFRAVITNLEKTGALVSERELVRAAGHTLTLSPADVALRDRLEQVYLDAALEAPGFDEALARAGGKPGAREHGRKILQMLIDDGQLLRVHQDLFFHRQALDQLIKKLRDYGARAGTERLIDVAAFKELAGISRKYAIPLLEYLDRERITRRAGDKRMIL